MKTKEELQKRLEELKKEKLERSELESLIKEVEQLERENFEYNKKKNESPAKRILMRGLSNFSIGAVKVGERMSGVKTEDIIGGKKDEKKIK